MKKLILLLTTIISLQLFAQDVHFTMYDVMPITLNPATTGGFDGDLRAALNYRNQWGSVAAPFRTFSFSIDGAILAEKWDNAKITLGLSAFKDVAGSTQFGTTKLNLSMATVLTLDKHNTLAAGLLGAFTQQSIDATGLRWSTQFDGQNYDSSAPSFEDFNGENIKYYDYSTGLLWRYHKNNNTISSSDLLTINAGIAYYHLNRPKTQLSVGDIDKLYGKWAFHTESLIGIKNTRVALKPKFLMNIQGPSKEFLFGFLGRYLLQEESKYTSLKKAMAIAAGAYYRVGDAIIPTIEFEIDKFAIGLAYDINISQLRKASNGIGGPEIFLKYQSPNPFSGTGRLKSKARFHDF